MEVIELLVCNTEMNALLVFLGHSDSLFGVLLFSILQVLKLSSRMGHKILGVMHPNRPHLLTVSLHLLCSKPDNIK